MSEICDRMHFFLATIFLLFVDIQALQIRPLMLANSVTLTPVKNVCVPREYVWARFKINYGKILEKLHDNMDAVNTAYGAYGVKDEAHFFLNKRICADAAKVRGVCPDDNMIMLQGQPASARQKVLIGMRKMDIHAIKIKRIIADLPTDFEQLDTTITIEDMKRHAEWPLTQDDSRNIAIVRQPDGLVLPPLTEEFLSSMDFLDGIPQANNKVSLPVSSNESLFITKADEILNNLVGAEEALNNLHQGLEKAQQNFFPKEIFPKDSWLAAALNITNPTTTDKNEIQTLEDMGDILRNLPTTSIQRNKNCDLNRTPRDKWSENCYVDAIVMIPNSRRIAQYTEKLLNPHPIPDPDDTKRWIKVEVPQQTVYKGKTKFYTTNSPWICHKEETQKCRWCSSNSMAIAIKDPCIISILNEAITKQTCSVSEAPIPETLEKIKDDGKIAEYIITSKESATLTETCGQETNTVPLLSASRAQVKSDCKLAYNNGPKDLESLFGTDSLTRTWTQVKGQTGTILKDTISQVILSPDLHKHIEDHKDIYLVTILIVVGMCCLISTCSGCIFLAKNRKYRIRIPDHESQMPLESRHLEPQPPMM